MKALYEALTVPHYLFGFVALLSFWGPLAVKKGGPAHKALGNVFFWSMIAVSVSSFAMATASLVVPAALHPTRDPGVSRAISVFLLYLGLVSITVVVNGRGTTRHKSNPEGQATIFYKVLNVGALVGSITVLALGMIWSSVLLMAMSPIGVLVARGYQKRLRALREDKRRWRSEHAGTMIVGGICVHTAFIAGGGTRFLPTAIADLGWWIWLVPTAVGVPVGMWLERKYMPSPT